jgi:uncharacterized delta-60 repeat protein
MSVNIDQVRGPDGVDPSFGDKGVFVVPSVEIPGADLDTVMLVVEPVVSGATGKIYLGCQDTRPAQDSAGERVAPAQYLVRLREHGQLDETFGKEGYCRLPRFLSRDGWFFIFTSITFGNDGVLTCLGNVKELVDSGAYFYTSMFRVTKAGSIDTSFGRGGYQVYRVPLPSTVLLTLDPSNSEETVAQPPVFDQRKLLQEGINKSGGAILLADGKITFLANIYSLNYTLVCSYLARINIDGALDTSFGEQGLILLTADDASGELLKCEVITTDSQEKIIVMGTSTDPFAYTATAARFDVDGLLDNSFGEAGRLSFNILGRPIRPISIIPTEGNYIFVFGVAGGPQTTALIKVLPNGAIDLGFNGGQPAFADLRPNGFVPYDAVMDQGRRIVISGTRQALEANIPQLTAVVARFMPGGMLDQAFGISGYAIYDNYYLFWSPEIQGLQKILVIANRMDSGMGVVTRLIG